MNMGFGLYQQKSMNLAMTSELRQAISILQYSTQELLSFLEEQHLDNPLLELKVKSVVDSQMDQSDSRNEAYDDSKVYEGDSISPFDNISKNDTNLHEYLLRQICYLPLTEKEKNLVKYLIYSIDENGYLSIKIEEVSKKLSISCEEILEGLDILQSLDPCGVGARSLQECLLLQLQNLKPRDNIAEAIVQNYLDLFAEKRWKEITKKLSISMEEVQRVSDLLQTLQPKPGSVFHDEPLSYIYPDINVELIEGELMVITNDRLLPNISINREYCQLLQQANDEKATKYLHQKYQQILWLLKSINQRQSTLLKVTKAIANYQKEFFIYGYEYLKPLTLKEIAAAVNMHESTVSRVTTQKYVQTPKGVFELKFFFSAGLNGEGRRNTSSLSVKEVIKKIVDNENKQDPLSDKEIVSILEKDYSIQVSRRTVNKYRDELKIPSSIKRKRF
ncbi:RNA polymerase sigma-54 factor [Anaerobacillus alkalidiazotrophicus]|uniref:RNA polymerase sigma-54 factor n=1 Tax=Anaerobacillus alkalidiazotrophicus TaxID=472963 RepID=A0A1S2M885_9BACI|nr:RNA polymerase factor sigma-54 [Anaerobacillus alkalidiazotrophicus]OIJ21032.1 RNA polymerase sigma-54 factor [Anaerobacillus alkalidiazotrophicus]